MILEKIKLLLGAYIDSVNAQDINCYNIAKYIDKDKFEVHALTHRADVNIPGVVCHPISKGRVLKNIEKYLIMKKIKADVYYLPRVEKVDIEFAKRSKKCITSSVEIQTVYENKTYKKFFNKYISGYFCISEFLNTLNMKYWGKKVLVLYLGVSADLEDICRKSLKNIIWIGSVVPRKRPEYLIELAEYFHNLNFIMVGDGKLLENIKYKTKEISNITFVGKTDNANVLEWLKRSDLLVITSEREGLPKVVLEAASKGVPSVYINEYYKIDYIENGINGYEVPDINSMIAVIELLASNDKKYISCSEHASKLARKYHWSILIKQYEDFFINTYKSREKKE